MRRMIGAAVQFSLEPMDVRANLEKAVAFNPSFTPASDALAGLSAGG